MIVVPDVQQYWSSRVGQVTKRDVALPTVGTFGYRHHQDSVRDYVHARYGICAVESDFRK